MTTSGQKRLDEVEVYLTPKEWAIRLAKEMREHPSAAAFWKSTTKREYRDWPWIVPFRKLAQQAEAHRSGKRPEDIDQRIQHDRKLRKEFQSLRMLIGTTNRIIRLKAETIALKTALTVSALQTLILKHTFSRTAKNAAACIERKDEGNGNNQTILEELRAYADEGSPSLIELLANDLAMLVEDIFDHETSVQLAQDRYFDAHPILFRDVERKLMQTIQATRDAVETFNEYLKVRIELFEAGPGHEDECKFAALGERAGHLTINIETIRNRPRRLIEVDKWMKNSMEDATTDILQETGEHETYHTRIFREMVEEWP